MAFTINFYLNYDNRLKKKERFIYCYLRENYQTISIHTKERIDPKFWDKSKQRVKKSHPNAFEINAYLDNLKNYYENMRREFFTINPEGSFIEFKHFLKSSRDVTFHDLLEKYIEFKKASGHHQLTKKIIALKKHFSIFENVYLNNIDTQKLDEFKIHLVKNNISINTRRKYFQLLFSTFRFALERGISINKAFEKYKIENNVEVTHIALTLEDLEKLINARLSEKLEKVRDLFLFQLYTGQRYSDILLFDKFDVKNDIWNLRVRKTKKTLQIPIIEPAKKILKKYDYKLPLLSNQKQNKYLKELGLVCGLDDIITVIEYKGNKEIKKQVPKYTQLCTHTARRTFVSIASYEGLNQQVVKSVTGHTTDRMLDQYFKKDIEETKKALSYLFKNN